MPADRSRSSRGAQRHPRTGPRTGPRRDTSGARAPRSAPTSAAVATPAEGRKRPRFTGRAAILVVVLAVLAVSYASSLRAYLQQRSHISDLKEQIAERRDNIDDLQREKDRWEDPEYVKQQARLRIGYVMPGETSYVVLDEHGNPIEPESELSDPSTVARRTPDPVYSDVWQSVKLAGDPPKQAPPPLSEIDGSKDPTGQ
jgi:cell division protein FtsB